MGFTMLRIRNIVAILLCGLANHVSSQINDISPARILTQQKTISENSDLYLTCSTFGKKNTGVYVYLCKDDVGILQKKQKPDQNDTTFTIPRVSLYDSGDYSCVYSINNDPLSRVDTRGHNVIQILVIANFLPADISVAGPSSVREGYDVEFRCTLSVTLQTLGECQLIHSYLQRDDTILQVHTFNVTKMEATFTIEEAVMRDAGHYSCVVLPSKCIQEHEEMIYGNNAVVLEVTGGLFLRWSISFGLISLALVLALCLCWINKQGSACASCSQCADSQPADIDMEEQQEQAQAEDLETQDDESFSIEDEDYQNGMVPEGGDDSSYDDCEGLYSVADDEPNAKEYVYAKANRKSKLQP